MIKLPGVPLWELPHAANQQQQAMIIIAWSILTLDFTSDPNFLTLHKVSEE